VIEDDRTIERFAQTTLELEGYAVRVSDGGREGLAALRQYRPDLLVLDLAMPEFSGWDVLRALREDRRLPDLPVVVLTAAADSEVQQRARALGIERFLVKPISARQLVSAVREVIGEP
jgi:chemosensory pili system protein ChpA (sensor histidine kinase/response regulator)